MVSRVIVTIINTVECWQSMILLAMQYPWMVILPTSRYCRTAEHVVLGGGNVRGSRIERHVLTTILSLSKKVRCRCRLKVAIPLLMRRLRH